MIKRNRFVYIVILAAILIPLLGKFSMTPVKLVSADRTYTAIESVTAKAPGKFAFVFIDYGPGTQAENDPQAQVAIEHLFRLRVPVVVMTTYALSERFSVEAPQKVANRLTKEDPTQPYEYGKDWIVLGYRPGAALFLQGLSQSNDLTSFLGADIKGKKLSEYNRFSTLHSLRDVSIAAEFTGLVGFLNSYIQFLVKKDSVVPLIHGCTSISIPETYIYTDSGQLAGVMEGIAGAASYADLLSNKYPKRAVDDAILINSALGFAQLAVLFLIVLGNCIDFFRSRRIDY